MREYSMKKLLAISLLFSTSAYSQQDPLLDTLRLYNNTYNRPLVQQNSDLQGNTTTTGINPYTGRIWSNTTNTNTGYTYGVDANGTSYSTNLYQTPQQKMNNDILMQGMQNLGAAIGGGIYNSQN